MVLGAMAQIISLATRDKIKARLKERAMIPRPTTVGDVLKAIRVSVRKMLKRGYDYEDVVTALAENNISVNVLVLEQFYAPSAKKGKGKAKPRPEPNELTVQVSSEQLSGAIARFEALARQRKGLNLQELVATLEQEIGEDLAAGYAFQEIAEWLESDFSVRIAPATLKRYYQNVKRGRTKQYEEGDHPLSEPKVIEVEKLKDVPQSRPKRLKETPQSHQDLSKEFNL